MQQHLSRASHRRVTYPSLLSDTFVFDLSVLRVSSARSDMQSLNALGNRQIASLNADLSRMESGEGGPAIQGELHQSRTNIDLFLSSSWT